MVGDEYRELTDKLKRSSTFKRKFRRVHGSVPAIPGRRARRGSIWKYARAEWGLEQAERSIELRTAAFRLLAESPKSAPACDHIRPRCQRRNVERHMIYFGITDYGIAIIRVIHAQMD